MGFLDFFKKKNLEKSKPNTKRINKNLTLKEKLIYDTIKNNKNLSDEQLATILNITINSLKVNRTRIKQKGFNFN
jgi:hypothetical protein